MMVSAVKREPEVSLGNVRILIQNERLIVTQRASLPYLYSSRQSQINIRYAE